MKGNNTLQLNEATIIAAVEYWLNQTQMREGATVKVESVTSKNDGSYSKTFEVTITEPKGEVPHG